MDPWINSLVQSPLVRSLNTVPSRMSSFAYGVRDNVPPFSFAKEVIDISTSGMGWSATASNAGAVNPTEFVFNIPESGLLNRAYLRVRYLGKLTRSTPLNNATGTGGAALVGKRERDSQSNSLNFGSIIDSISLKTLNYKDIETIYPSSIAAEVSKMPSCQREFWEEALCGFNAGVVGVKSGFATTTSLLPPFTRLYNPYAQHVTSMTDVTAVGGSTVYQQAQAVDFLIPLTFSFLHQLKDNFQTRFVDDLQITVKFKDDAGMAGNGAGSTTTGFRASLVCIYHNFHDVIENSIRDQNFKRGFPASIYTHNHIREANKTASGKILTFRIGSRNLISELYLNLLHSAPSDTTVHATALPPSTGVMGPFKFTLSASGRQIWQAYSWELAGPDVADYQLADAHAYGEDLAKPIRGRRVYNRSIMYEPDTGSLGQTAFDIVTLGFPHLHCVRFGFQANDNFYTGGLALQTLSNPTFEIENLGISDWSPTYTMDLILKTCVMLRIDSDTGVITTSLDV